MTIDPLWTVPVATRRGIVVGATKHTARQTLVELEGDLATVRRMGAPDDASVAPTAPGSVHLLEVLWTGPAHEQDDDEPTPQQVLDCPMDPDTNDAGASTVRGYLLALLTKVWTDQDEFSGKRPFGNSGWSYEVHAALIRAGLLEGVLDEHGYVDEVDSFAGDDLVQGAIAALGSPR